MQLVAENKAAAVFPALSMKNNYFIKNGLVKPMRLRDFTLPIRFFLLYPDNRALLPSEQMVIRIIKKVNLSG